MTAMQIRPATEADLEAIRAIYNHEIRTSTCTMDTEPRDETWERDWFESHRSAAHPLLVAEVDGLVVGWASLTPWSPRGAYRRTVEASVFVRQGHRQKRIGTELLAALIARAGEAGHRVILGRVEATNAGSRKLATSLGFTSVGVMHRVGEKLGRILDVEIFELALPGPRDGPEGA